MDGAGKFVRKNGGLQRDPEFWAPDYWRAVRAAGIDTPEQCARNPHMFLHMVEDCVFVNDGPGGIGVANNGTAPVAPVRAAEYDPETETSEEINPERDQDDYQELPPEWVERSICFVVRPTVETVNDARRPFRLTESRHASAWNPRAPQEQWASQGTDQVLDGTLARVVVIDGESPPWLPRHLPLPGIATLWPQYAGYGATWAGLA